MAFLWNTVLHIKLWVSISSTQGDIYVHVKINFYIYIYNYILYAHADMMVPRSSWLSLQQWWFHLWITGEAPVDTSIQHSYESLPNLVSVVRRVPTHPDKFCVKPQSDWDKHSHWASTETKTRIADITGVKSRHFWGSYRSEFGSRSSPTSQHRDNVSPNRLVHEQLNMGSDSYKVIVLPAVSASLGGYHLLDVNGGLIHLFALLLRSDQVSRIMRIACVDRMIVP